MDPKARWQVLHGNCLDVLKTLPDNSIDAVVTDPPYGLSEHTDIQTMVRYWFVGKEFVNKSAGFMGKDWDSFVPGPEIWREVKRVLKPGGYLLAFSGSRTMDLMGISIRFAGFRMSDTVMAWVYGCLSEDTELLIDGEWKHYRSATPNSLTLCYDAEHDSYSWQPIERVYVYDYDDTAYRIESATTDQVVSRNHRCLVGRDGKWEFVVAEEVARQSEARVPVLEAVSGLLDALRLPQRNAGAEKSVLRDVSRKTETSAETDERTPRTERAEGVVRTNGDAGSFLRGVQQASLETEGLAQANEAAGLLAGVQRGFARSGIGEARAQGARGVEREVPCGAEGEDAGSQQSGVEGRSHLQERQGQLHRPEVRPLPAGVFAYGPEGWLRHGTSTGGGENLGAMSDADGGSASRQPRHAGQLTGEPNAFRYQPGPQAVRGEGHTGSSLARVTPFHYVGTVWCVKVPTGAFVARRNGKVFVTGNSGFPKGLNISKAIDKAAGMERKSAYKPNHRNSVLGKGMCGGEWNAPSEPPVSDEAKQWEGWNTALKPAFEPVLVAQKPFDCTIAENVLTHGTGAINIDGCRVVGVKPRMGERTTTVVAARSMQGSSTGRASTGEMTTEGRWPPNVLLTHHPDCVEGGECHAECGTKLMDEQSGEGKSQGRRVATPKIGFGMKAQPEVETGYGDSGGASRFFPQFYYHAKASRREREDGCDALPDSILARSGGAQANGESYDQGQGIGLNRVSKVKNTHPTVKPSAVMQWLIRLVTPPGGVVLDPFNGSGSTGIAAMKEGMRYVGIEREAEYVEISKARIAHAAEQTEAKPFPKLTPRAAKTEAHMVPEGDLPTPDKDAPKATRSLDPSTFKKLVAKGLKKRKGK